MTAWKWIRVHDITYNQLKEMGQFGESFNDIITRLIVNQGSEAEGRTTVVTRDEVKARLKKFDSHTKAIARLVKENISYTDK